MSKGVIFININKSLNKKIKMVIKKNKKTLKVSKSLMKKSKSLKKKSKKSKKMKGGDPPPKISPGGNTGSSLKRVKSGNTTYNPKYTKETLVGIANPQKTFPKQEVISSPVTKTAFEAARYKFGASNPQTVKKQNSVKLLTPNITKRVAEAVAQFSAKNAIANQTHELHNTPNTRERTAATIKSLSNNGGLYSNNPQGKIYSEPIYATANNRPKYDLASSSSIYNIARTNINNNSQLSPKNSGYMEIGQDRGYMEIKPKNYTNMNMNFNKLNQQMREFAAQREKEREQIEQKNYEPYYATVGPKNQLQNYEPYYATVGPKTNKNQYQNMSNAHPVKTSPYYSTIPEKENIYNEIYNLG
jgi:hypothetical protein